MSGELGGGGDIASGGEIAGGGSEISPSTEIGGEAATIELSEPGLDTAIAEPPIAEPAVEADGFDVSNGPEVLNAPEVLDASEVFDRPPIEPAADVELSDTLSEPSPEPAVTEAAEQPSDTDQSEIPFEPEAGTESLAAEAGSEFAPLSEGTELPAEPAEPPETTETELAETSEPSDRGPLAAKSNEGPVEPPEQIEATTDQGKQENVDTEPKETNTPDAEPTEPRQGVVPRGEEEFAAFKAAAEKSAIESINEDQVLDAIDKLDKGLPITSEPRQAYPLHVRGYIGEEGAAQQAQRTGGMVVDAKVSFSDTTNGGIDLAELRAGEEGPILAEGDNKVQNTKETVSAVSSLTRTHEQNEAAILNKASDLENNGTLEADRLVGGATREAITDGRTVKEVTNVGAMGVGAQRVSERVEQAGVTFRDMASEMADAARNSKVIPERINPLEDI